MFVVLAVAVTNIINFNLVFYDMAQKIARVAVCQIGEEHLFTGGRIAESMGVSGEHYTYMKAVEDGKDGFDQMTVPMPRGFKKWDVAEYNQRSFSDSSGFRE